MSRPTVAEQLEAMERRLARKLDTLTDLLTMPEKLQVVEDDVPGSDD